MRLLAALALALAWGASLAEAKAVFAHFMVGNTKSLSLDDWRTEIGAAQGAGIDAFALNMASDDSTNDIALPMAFTAADDMGFQLLFSFDYAGNGPWDKSVVINIIKEYGSRETYFKHNSDPFVSTFEGPSSADDWNDIKKETNCFFIPDCWDAWPKGPANMTTYPNASYYDFLGSKPYMMPISPWFYTNLPGYNKNWLWRGDDMWFQRWQQAISIDRKPDWIQIISWNDYGESHYISRLDDQQYEAFDIGRAPYNYVKDMPHDGWRETLSATITEERLVIWFRVNKNGAYSDHGTTGNTANQLHVLIGSASGQVVVTVKRGGTIITSVTGASITSTCNSGLNNYNPWVGSNRGPPIDPVKTKGDLDELDCIKGFGVYEFISVCDFACSNGYCPSTACTCLEKGVANPTNETGVDGYPLPGKSGSFAGLCSFNCNHGYCPDSVCGETPNNSGLCDFGCHLGFCPIHACTCAATGILVEAPAKTDETGYYLDSSCAPPCVLILPPLSLASPTTISFNPWPTSLELGWTTTDTVDGTRTTHYTAVTVSTEISIPPVTTGPVSPPPFVISPTKTTIDGITATPVSRTIRPPPWPWTAASGVPDPSGTTTTSTSSGATDDSPTTTSTYITDFPTETVSWVREWVPEPTAFQVNGGNPTPVVPCWAWFIWSCPPDVGGVVLSGFTEPGIYPEGGPPAVAPNPPPGLTLKLPWPQITIGPDLKPTYPEQPEPDEDICETATASVCTTTLSYGVVAKRAVAPTQAPQIHGEEDEITTATSISATATTQPRGIIPRDTRRVDGVRTTLQQQLGGSSLDLFESRTDLLGTIFFFVPAFTDDQTAAIRERSVLAKRSETVQSNQPDVMAMLSWPPGTGPVPQQGAAYRFDSSAGEGTYVYDLDYGADPEHDEFSDVLGWMENDEKRHGTACLSKAVGKTVGVARKATAVATVWDFNKGIYEHWLDGLAKVHADISAGGRGTKSALSTDHSCLAMLIRELISLGAVVVTGSGNRPAGYPNGYPALFGEPGNRNEIKDLIVVGAVLGEGALGRLFKDAPWLTCYAPGHGVRVAGNLNDGYHVAGGTSYSSATVAGLAAYFRGLDPTLTTAARVKQRIVDLAYRRPAPVNRPNDVYPGTAVWNGQMGGRSVAGDCSGGVSKIKRQSSSNPCPVAFPPQASPLTFRTGAPQPTCARTGCGSSCGGGFFCAGSPLQQNPDFLDPRNPDSVQNPDSPYYDDWDGTITRTSTTTSTRTATTAAPTSTGIGDGSIGSSCLWHDQCDANCPTDQKLRCRGGTCTCADDQNLPPLNTQCQGLSSCLGTYWCYSKDHMVCEPRDHTNGNSICLCVAGNED
ncbi:glycosyl hydrolase family 71-domain-containing protein [Aspergillus pseudodeflectus]|uniref:Glycosyl hydrolase family 71-domain-containing protein n=1 Tax=Aspergillus pseudodeflectus TaxID=176178 RepID=A0ABR4K0U9_9EURO